MNHLRLDERKREVTSSQDHPVTPSPGHPFTLPPRHPVTLSPLHPVTEGGLLYPLDLFYERSGTPLPAAQAIAGEEVPEPYRRLLVHRDDMTPTLEAFHGDRIHIRKLERAREGDSYMRQVLLVLDGSEQAVEFGAIVIHLAEFPAAARELILGERCPLGTVLALHEIEHLAWPQGFFTVEPDALISEALGLPERRVLYGRRNVHATPDGRVLADILEVLPPAD